MFHLHKINLHSIVGVTQCWRYPMSALPNVGVNQCLLSTDILKHFTDEGDIVIAKLQKIKDFSKFLSLYLEEDVLVLYLELYTNGEGDIKIIKKTKLREAFSDRVFQPLPSYQILKGQGNKLMCFLTKQDNWPV